MSKHGFFQNRAWLKISGILALGMIIFLVGWTVSGVLAQSGGGSEPGANLVQTDETGTGKPTPSSPSEAGIYTPSEPGANLVQTDETGTDERAPSPPAEAGVYTPSEPGANLVQTDETSTDRLPPSSPSEAGVYTPSESGNEPPITVDSAGINSVWPNLWYNVIGAAFIPSESTMAYSYGYYGCVQPLSTGWWRASVNLPDGAVIKYIYINYYNANPASTSTSVAIVTRYKYDGTSEDLVYVNSRPGTVTGAGYFFDLSAEVTFTVNNLSYGYAFIWSGGTTQKLCSIQVGYYPPPLYITNLPFITK
jgi:hypothetical protein